MGRAPPELYRVRSKAILPTSGVHRKRARDSLLIAFVYRPRSHRPVIKTTSYYALRIEFPDGDYLFYAGAYSASGNTMSVWTTNAGPFGYYCFDSRCRVCVTYSSKPAGARLNMKCDTRIRGGCNTSSWKPLAHCSAAYDNYVILRDRPRTTWHNNLPESFGCSLMSANSPYVENPNEVCVLVTVLASVCYLCICIL